MTSSYRICSRLFWISVAFLALSVSAQAGPIIVGDAGNRQCQVTLEMAKSAFDSRSPTLNWPVSLPKDPMHRVVISRASEDISGGDAIAWDPTVFEKRKLSSDIRSTIYWQKIPVGRNRVVVVDLPFNWRGHWYTPMLINSDANFDESYRYFIKDSGSYHSSNLPSYDNRWNPPYIFMEIDTRELWLIDQGEPYDVMTPWRVLALSQASVTSPCSIAFRPTAKPDLSYLPKAVRRLAHLADEALGPGNDEGTLRPTSRIRLDVAKEWANSAYRPWALNRKPYNSRGEVDSGLRRWAETTTKKATVFRELQLSHRPAERAMTNFYARRFGLNPAEARVMGTYSIDYMLRHYFVFHREKTEQPTTLAPWPRRIRR